MSMSKSVTRMIDRKNSMTKSFIKQEESIMEKKSEKSEVSQKKLKKKNNFIKSMIKSEKRTLVNAKVKGKIVKQINITDMKNYQVV